MFRSGLLLLLLWLLRLSVSFDLARARPARRADA
jgi:hypothetical protein